MLNSTLSSDAPELSVVIPFFNEGPNIVRLIEELRIVLEHLGKRYEVICVNDGSTDETGSELERIAAVWGCCRFLSFASNRGQAAALLAGLRVARGAVLVTMDGDGQNDPADIPFLLAKLDAGADMVAGIRAQRRDSALRRAMSRVANHLRSRILRDGMSDSGCALKAFRTEVTTAFLPIRTLYSFMPALAVAAGFRVVEERVGHRPRMAGESKYGLKAMLWRPALDMLGIWWFTRRRLRDVAEGAEVYRHTESVSYPIPPAGLVGVASHDSAPELQIWRESPLTGDVNAKDPLTHGVTNALSRWAWLAFALAALFLFLGTRGLNEPDEGRYAEIGREMAESTNWLVPHLNGFEHFQKPPLLYFCTAASIRLFGANAWAARLPSALAALGTVLLVFSMGNRLLGRKRAIAAVLVLVSSIEFFLLARLLTPDMLLTFWTTAAIAALIYRREWLFFVCMGFGFLTKGPVALMVPLCAALGTQVFTPREDRLRVPWFRGTLLTLAIGLAWFLALSAWRSELFDYFFRYELIERFASKAHGRSKPFWFFIPVLLGGFLPWTFFLLRGAVPAWRRWRSKNFTATHGLLLGWTLPPLLILSLSGSKLPTYILPLFPAFALAVATQLRVPARAWRIALPTAACWVVLAALSPRFDAALGQQASVCSLTSALAAQPGADVAQVFACEVRAHGLEFYLQRLVSATRGQSDIVLTPNAAQSTRLYDSPASLERAFAGGPPAFGLVRTHRFAKTFPRDRWRVIAQSGDFLLVSNQPSTAQGPSLAETNRQPVARW